MKYILLLTYLTLFSSYIVAKETSVRIVATDWCPRVCFDNKEELGYLVEFTDILFKSIKDEFSIVNMPWIRAINSVNENKSYAILAP
jgi:hypothetical protein